jgi:hypothetical protein
VRNTLSDPQLGYVNAYGYVSLFPFLLQILRPDNPKLEIILKVEQRHFQRLPTLPPGFLQYQVLLCDNPLSRIPILLFLGRLKAGTIVRNSVFTSYVIPSERLTAIIIEYFCRRYTSFEKYASPWGGGSGMPDGI